MKKRITITLSQESYIKLQLLAEKKKWSLSKTVEDILERQLAKYKNEQKLINVAGVVYEKGNS
jgi:metal-responsive CopG/Arc/MetJ family transcriptional regulator